MPKVEILSEESHLNLICRDTHFPHQVRTKTCEALSKLPLAMSLYSGSLSLFSLSLHTHIDMINYNYLSIFS